MSPTGALMRLHDGNFSMSSILPIGRRWVWRDFTKVKLLDELQFFRVGEYFCIVCYVSKRDP